MIFNEAVNYIHSLQRFGIRPGLAGMDALLSYLGNPHNGLSFVHVAGTNGKGSTSTAISNVLVDSGYQVGLYTSPFVSHFLERIQFNGSPVKENIFSESVSQVKKGVEHLSEQGIIITEFEALTAAAFLCFKKLSCDVVVLEVGLGGRLDATNVIPTPLCNVITSLSLDHTGVLGDSIEKITFEKCGTIKRNSRVVVSMGQPEKAMEVIEKTVNDTLSSLIIPSEESVVVHSSDLFGTDFSYKGEGYNISMPGIHQVKNMTCVIEACNVLKEKFNISLDSVKRGISRTKLPARVEILSQKPLVILDGGHNEDGATAFFECVKNYLGNYEKVYVLGGMMADKEVENSLAPLMKNIDCFVSVTPDNPRAMNCDDLQKISQKYCKENYAFSSPCDGVDFVLRRLKKDEAFLCVGSLYLAGEIRDYLIENLKNSH